MSEESNEMRTVSRRIRHKRNLERTAMSIMALGALMMFQPFALVLYTYSFVVILVGTLMFIIVSHLPD
jgi:hypothetical protein